jgi:hypothetical protein
MQKAIYYSELKAAALNIVRRGILAIGINGSPARTGFDSWRALVPNEPVTILTGVNDILKVRSIDVIWWARIRANWECLSILSDPNPNETLPTPAPPLPTLPTLNVRLTSLCIR